MKELIELTAEQLGLTQPSVVEKDYYVTQIIHLLSDIQNPYFSLVFKGGTCLTKAHHITQRMSEDCDFRILTSHLEKKLSKSQLLKQLKDYRHSMIKTLNDNGFNIDIMDKSKVTVGDEGNYMKVSLSYPSKYRQASSIRPDILLEFFVGELKTPIENLSITTLIRTTLDDKITHPAKIVNCVSIVETAAEKWVALTRRIATIAHRGEDEDTPALIRHLYDLYMINVSHKLDNDFYGLIMPLIKEDKERFKTYNNDYVLNPTKEIQRAIDLLTHDPIWENYWNKFIDDMVYSRNIPTYKETISFFKSISQKAIVSFKSE